MSGKDGNIGLPNIADQNEKKKKFNILNICI